MRWKKDDLAASALVAAVVSVYAAYLAFDGIPFVRDARGMAAVGLIGGFLSRRIGGRAGFAHERLAFGAGLASFGLGIAALATENSVVLAAFVGSIVVLWAWAVFTVARSTPRRVHAAQGS